MKAKRVINSAVSLGIGLALASCTSVRNWEERESILVGPTWYLSSVEQGGATETLSGEESLRHSAIFSADGSVSMTLDCNRGQASWSAKAYKRDLTISQIAATKALCPEPSWDDDMTAFLAGTSSYGFADGDRTLVLSKEDTILRFTSVPPESD